MCDMVTPTVGSILSNKKGSLMNEHFIKNIEIKNFKCFEDFKAEGFGRVNLIGGKNNVGKTAFMEACFFTISVDAKSFIPFLEALISLEYFRNHEIVHEFDNLDINQYVKLLVSLLKKYIDSAFFSNQNNISIVYDNELIITINKEKYGLNDFNPLNINTEIEFSTRFITSLFIDNTQLNALYDGVKSLRKRNEVNTFITKFDDSILEYDVIEDKPVCFSEKENRFVSLSEYGNGMKRYIAYICALWANKNGHVFIDEIENGIHYTHLDKLWEIILKTSKQTNCQVFATTHSKECIESYARVAKELEEESKIKKEDIKFIKLSKKDDGTIMAGVRDYEMLQYAIEDGHEVRGW
ncbi:MAG: FIG00565050: hypothetical protein [uncultured Sulfurovum sp.]|uniref:ATPase AAA-type core domain-containing protein n=1 Tax=uncultured Sulfurovum sp. TaxID=269237 RepID=A0A6S6SUL2_9BACT|nr:MAG: FIG00565050: hypothetical protein [uncultured Sulfurovum sp.]